MDWKRDNMIIPGLKTLNEDELKAISSEEGDAGDDDKEIRRIILTMDGCGPDLNAMVRYIDSVHAHLPNLTVLKLFALGTALWQAHDAGKSHPIYRKCMQDDYGVIMDNQDALLPRNYKEIYQFLEDCKMPPSTLRTIWKHCINCEKWFDEAYSPSQLASAYANVG